MTEAGDSIVLDISAVDLSQAGPLECLGELLIYLDDTPAPSGVVVVELRPFAVHIYPSAAGVTVSYVLAGVTQFQNCLALT